MATRFFTRYSWSTTDMVSHPTFSPVTIAGIPREIGVGNEDTFAGTAALTPAWTNLLVSWARLLVLVGSWIWLFRKSGWGGGRHAKYMERSLLFMEREEQLVERIATALEQRNKARD